MTEPSPRGGFRGPYPGWCDLATLGPRRTVDPSARGPGVEPALAGRVLLVDDEQRIGNFVRRGLEAEGLEVDAAGGGEEGLGLRRSRSFGLVTVGRGRRDGDWVS